MHTLCEQKISGNINKDVIENVKKKKEVGKKPQARIWLLVESNPQSAPAILRSELRPVVLSGNNALTIRPPKRHELAGWFGLIYLLNP